MMSHEVRHPFRQRHSQVTLAVTSLVVGVVAALFAFSLGVSMTTGRYTSDTKVTVDTLNLPDSGTPDPDCYFQVGRQLDKGSKHVVVTPVCP